MSVPGLQTVHVIRRVPRVDGNGVKLRDDRGNPIVDQQAPVAVPQCSVQPGVAPETIGEGHELVNSGLTIYAPLSWPGEEGDLVLVDGDTWRTRGRPQRWNRPAGGHVIATVERVSG